MKKGFLLISLFAVSSIAFAQLKLDDQGKTILGNYTSSLRFDCRGPATFTRWDAEWEKIHIDWNNVYSAAQIYCTAENFTVGTSSYYVGCGYFRFMHFMNPPSITSDARLKENIQPIESALDKLMLVNGKSFNFIDNFSDNLKITSLRDRNSKTTYGFIAQELKEVLPEIVNDPDEMSEYYSVDYIAMIPLLVEALKEQQSQISELQEQIANIGHEGIEEKSTRIHNDENESESSETNAILYQNTPNPFNVETEIRYYIPENTGQSSLLIFDMQGTLKKQLRIFAIGNGSVTVSASELPAGMYIYSLIVDGREIDSKRMILTE